jgi:CheY-like chemotaxis protein
MISGIRSSASRAITILFVDDDTDTLFAYALVARDGGMAFEVARDGHEAIALANVLLPDVIVLDLGLRSLDGLDGFEVTRRLRAHGPTSAIPIVIVSGYDGERDLAELRASGCDGHLVKPCSADALLELVSSLACEARDKTVANDVAMATPHELPAGHGAFDPAGAPDGEETRPGTPSAREGALRAAARGR